MKKYLLTSSYTSDTINKIEKSLESEEKTEIESILISIFNKIGINKPNNLDIIIEFCYQDVKETADPKDWTSEDVLIAFRRYIEQ